jgi:hypothetical protein
MVTNVGELYSSCKAKTLLMTLFKLSLAQNIDVVGYVSTFRIQIL